jgi:hypothetical protein
MAYSWDAASPDSGMQSGVVTGGIFPPLKLPVDNGAGAMVCFVLWTAVVVDSLFILFPSGSSLLSAGTSPFFGYMAEM